MDSIYICFAFKPNVKSHPFSFVFFVTLLGNISLFVLKVKLLEGGHNPFEAMSDPDDHTMAQIGISLEPLSDLVNQTPEASTVPSNVVSFFEFTQKMLHSLFNFAASFATTQQLMTPNPTENYVPLSVIKTWYTNFERKMAIDPNFWKNL